MVSPVKTFKLWCGESNNIIRVEGPDDTAWCSGEFNITHLNQDNKKIIKCIVGNIFMYMNL